MWSLTVISPGQNLYGTVLSNESYNLGVKTHVWFTLLPSLNANNFSRFTKTTVTYKQIDVQQTHHRHYVGGGYTLYTIGLSFQPLMTPDHFCSWKDPSGFHLSGTTSRRYTSPTIAYWNDFVSYSKWLMPNVIQQLINVASLQTLAKPPL